MGQHLEKKIEDLLIGIISDGFNRSVGALESAGAIDTKNIRAAYAGAGSKCYDMVTEQIVRTAHGGSKAIMREISGLTTEVLGARADT